MCGHGTIGTCTVAIETGLVGAHEPLTHVPLDTPAGRVTAEATVQQGRVKKVKIRNVPSFLYRKDVQVEVESIGPIHLDIAYGGYIYSILSVEKVGRTTPKKKTPGPLYAGRKIIARGRPQIPPPHPP